ncbi:hypothetical protein PHLGIDRAFT_104748 [Phlebiopsis gigantea 11061_1 CR5-6]|uniref:N-acetyltransferase ECO1 n=1 Tax=Phlebiopsis gigantea (strain 11061_1 CR5-6) TaxID=745531 RepID=A0A0C3PN36_PHLG1|nr:hypothetical protein PHLGIDRAFT_104748 [Phlebiopsis gigantea 11061_1 CR5-6]
MSSRVKRTYGSRPTRTAPLLPPSSPPSALSSSPHRGGDDEHDDDGENGRGSLSELKRKRPHLDDWPVNAPPAKRPLSLRAASGKAAPTAPFPSSRDSKARGNPKPKKGAKEPENLKQKQLTQLHFALDTTVLRTCAVCSLTYTRAAPDDESLHRAHCARVQRGMEWGKEEEREAKNGKVRIEEVRTDVKLPNGAKGRVVCFRADVGGKIGSKLTTLLETINITLSAPALTPQCLQSSKAYLFLLSSPSPSGSSYREKVIGCVIAQRISTAMAIAPREGSESTPSSKDSSAIRLIPTPLPTPLGIPRLFVSSAHRRLGVASTLLTAAAETFILGCPLDPKKGEVAFTQPTGLGGMVLENWAGGRGRVYEE